LGPQHFPKLKTKEIIGQNENKNSLKYSESKRRMEVRKTLQKAKPNAALGRTECTLEIVGRTNNVHCFCKIIKIDPNCLSDVCIC
jgi:hypothetical protein